MSRKTSKRLTATKPAPTVGRNTHQEPTMSATTTENAPKSPKPANGAKAKPDASPDAQTSGESPESSEATAKRRGIIPTMPAAILYRQNGRVYAAIHHPLDGTSYIESGKGEGSAMGALVDSGFRLSSLTDEGAEWLAAKLPAGATLLGYASIKGFPLPSQGV